MIQLIYLSFFSRDLSDAELEDILSVSRQHNETLGITGLLIVKGRAFLQALEGEKEAVYRLYDTIKKDARHREIMKISEEVITERAFANWSMGFKNLEALSAIESKKLADFSQMDWHAESFSQQRSEIHELFRQFVDIDKDISLL